MANNRQLNVYISSVVARYAQPNIVRNAKRVFERAKAAAIVEFDNHPITKALENHTGGGLSQGTLFGFIGFEEGEKPTSVIRNMLYGDLEFGGVVKLSNTKFAISYSYPTREEIYDATPLPWAEGRSWCEMLDTTGIPGLGLYIGIQGKGRSKEGIQNNRSKLTGNKMGKVPYISQILNNFIKNINSQLKDGLEFQ